MLRRWHIALAALFALGVALASVKKAASLGSPDFRVFYTAAQHAIHDPANIYKLSPDRYLYPPSTALILTPFAFSENYAFHQWVWHGCLALATFALAAVSLPALAALALLTRYLAITFNYGQINLMVVALLALVASRRRMRPAGSLWALATSLKVYPAVFAPFFFPRARWSAWGGAALGFTLILFLPFAFFGLDLGLELYGEFFEALRSKGLPLHSHNQSFAALFLRLGTPEDFYLQAVGTTHWGLVHWPSGLLRLLAFMVGLVLSGLTWWRAWRRGCTPEAALSAAAFSVLFLSHIVWKDYFLFLYFPLRELFARLPRRSSWILAGAYFAVLTLSAHDVVGAPLSTRLDAGCIHLWAAILIWGVWWTSYRSPR